MRERQQRLKVMAYCVDCGETMTLSGRVEMGQIVSCPECGATMQVVSLDPVIAIGSMASPYTQTRKKSTGRSADERRLSSADAG